MPSRNAVIPEFLVTLLLWSGSTSVALAHHSYADFNQEQIVEFRGTLEEVFWGNPHILLTISNGVHRMQVEWVTTAGADVTNVTWEQFATGDSITVLGNRHRDPDTYRMARIREIRLKDKNWQWLSPEGRGKR